MAQASKKSSASAAQSAKFEHTHRAQQATLSAMESGRSSAENVVRLGTEAVRELLSTSAEEAQKAQEKVFSFGRESAENFARSADAATKSMYEVIAIGRENIEACVECSNIAADMTKSLSAEAFDYANSRFAENVEMTKEFLSCRTMNDMFDLHSRYVKSAMDSFFNESAKMSEIFFRYATEAAEPINERVAEATERFSKSLAA